ncbi:hypothetical protein FRC07_010208 [Ceratobasidium sp. 392]|nr:hypothetical protein FRC07_010208 [Ceratobasidium sp. 392]
MSIAKKQTADAYIVIVPEPRSGVLGFKRHRDDDPNADDRGQYMFWIKIGDSGDPMGRLQEYLNPDQAKAIVRLTNCPSTKPGKILETTQLGRIGVTDTEWHALYARDKDGATALCTPTRVYAIYVLVTPNTNTENLGVADGTSTRYSIQIKSAETPHITAYTLMSERFKTLIPSFSFNGFRVDTANELPRVVEMMKE